MHVYQYTVSRGTLSYPILSYPILSYPIPPYGMYFDLKLGVVAMSWQSQY